MALAFLSIKSVLSSPWVIYGGGFVAFTAMAIMMEKKKKKLDEIYDNSIPLFRPNNHYSSPSICEIFEQIVTDHSKHTGISKFEVAPCIIREFINNSYLKALDASNNEVVTRLIIKSIFRSLNWNSGVPPDCDYFSILIRFSQNRIPEKSLTLYNEHPEYDWPTARIEEKTSLLLYESNRKYQLDIKDSSDGRMMEIKL